MAVHTINPSDRPVSDIQQTQVKCVLLDAAKCGRCHHDVVNSIKIRLKIRCHLITMSKFVAEQIIKSTSVCSVESIKAEAMINKQAVHVAANVVKLFMLTFVVLQTIPFLDSEILMCLYKPLRTCWQNVWPFSDSSRLRDSTAHRGENRNLAAEYKKKSTFSELNLFHNIQNYLLIFECIHFCFMSKFKVTLFI